jgi:hypothetical protein
MGDMKKFEDLKKPVLEPIKEQESIENVANGNKEIFGGENSVFFVRFDSREREG